jgi:hypothetical protein
MTPFAYATPFSLRPTEMVRTGSSGGRSTGTVKKSGRRVRGRDSNDEDAEQRRFDDWDQGSFDSEAEVPTSGQLVARLVDGDGDAEAEWHGVKEESDSDADAFASHHGNGGSSDVEAMALSDLNSSCDSSTHSFLNRTADDDDGASETEDAAGEDETEQFRQTEEPEGEGDEVASQASSCPSEYPSKQPSLAFAGDGTAFEIHEDA